MASGRAWEWQNLHTAALCVRFGRRLLWAEAEYVGLGPPAMQVGDDLCNLYGGSVLYIVRDRDDRTQTFVGECYVHGLMDGEALATAAPRNRGEDEIFDFV